MKKYICSIYDPFSPLSSCQPRTTLFCELYFYYEHNSNHIFKINRLEMWFFTSENFTIHSNQTVNSSGNFFITSRTHVIEQIKILVCIAQLFLCQQVCCTFSYSETSSPGFLSRGVILSFVGSIFTEHPNKRFYRIIYFTF